MENKFVPAKVAERIKQLATEIETGITIPPSAAANGEAVNLEELKKSLLEPGIGVTEEKFEAAYRMALEEQSKETKKGFWRKVGEWFVEFEVEKEHVARESSWSKYRRWAQGGKIRKFHYITQEDINESVILGYKHLSQNINFIEAIVEKLNFEIKSRQFEKEKLGESVYSLKPSFGGEVRWWSSGCGLEYSKVIELNEGEVALYAKSIETLSDAVDKKDNRLLPNFKGISFLTQTFFNHDGKKLFTLKYDDANPKNVLNPGDSLELLIKDDNIYKLLPFDTLFYADAFQAMNECLSIVNADWIALQSGL